MVIGVGVKNSTSDLLTANCDEFIFYDDLIDRKRSRRRGGGSKGGQKPARSPQSKAKRTPEDKKQEAFDLVVETYEALLEERGEEDKIWGSMIKQTLKRRKPGFTESFYGFRSFGDLLSEAEEEGVLKLERDQKSGGFIIKDSLVS
jgi:hypothetical protein